VPLAACAPTSVVLGTAAGEVERSLAVNCVGHERLLEQGEHFIR
jgi:hypothetical protein